MARSVVVLVGLGLAGCQSGTSDTPSLAVGPEPVLVFSDDFERPDFGDSWQTTSATWKIEEGWVMGGGARNEGMWLSSALPAQVRLSFDAQALSEEGDLKFEMFADGTTHQSGYVGIFGGWDNRLNIIARLDEHGDDRLVGAEGQHVEVGKTYRFQIERTDNRMRWSIDGVDFITFDDSDPLTGAGHAYFGFNNWESPVRFDNVEVWDLAPE